MTTARERERDRERRRRIRRAPSEVTEAAQTTAAEGLKVGSVAVAMPAWRWRTFPVFFALSVGLLVGTYAGAAAGIANENGNGTPLLVVFVVAAVLMGVSLSRFMTRWMMSKNWVKPRPARKKT